jgi:hypothetical protein
MMTEAFAARKDKDGRPDNRSGCGRSCRRLEGREYASSEKLMLIGMREAGGKRRGERSEERCEK